MEVATGRGGQRQRLEWRGRAGLLVRVAATGRAAVALGRAGQALQPAKWGGAGGQQVQGARVQLDDASMHRYGSPRIVLRSRSYRSGRLSPLSWRSCANCRSGSE